MSPSPRVVAVRLRVRLSPIVVATVERSGFAVRLRVGGAVDVRLGSARKRTGEEALMGGHAEGRGGRASLHEGFLTGPALEGLARPAT